MSLKIKPNESLLTHFQNFDDIVAELISAGARLDEMDKTSHLLLTLPTAYDGVITALETLSEDGLNLAFVKTRLLDYEIKLKTEEFSNKALQMGICPQSSRSSSQPRSKNTKGGKNKYSEQSKHHLKKHYKTKFNKSLYKTSQMRCDHCGRLNHIKKNCYYYKRMMEASQSPQVVQTANSNFAFMVGEFGGIETSGREVSFILDSGATDHIVNNADLFDVYVDLDKPIEIATAKVGTSVKAMKSGRIKIKTNLGIEGFIENVLYVPDLQYNLLSVRRIQASGMTIIFGPQGVEIKNGNQTILTGEPFNGLVAIKFEINKTLVRYEHKVNIVNTYQLWHARLGHISKNSFYKMKAHEMVEDINYIKTINPSNELCEACIYGKQSRLPFNNNKNKNHVERPLFIIHTDVCGPINPPTVDNKNYFVTFIDEYTHYTVTYLITFKGEVLDVFKDFILKATAHFNSKIAYIYCDNGREYLSNEFKDLCVQNGITYHLTVPYTPQQNGVAERMNRTILKKSSYYVDRFKIR